MPFVEIGNEPSKWINIKDSGISVSKELRDEYFDGRRVRLFFDEENMLFGLKPSETGYCFSKEKISRKHTPPNLPRGKFVPKWSEKHGMLVADLNSPL